MSALRQRVTIEEFWRLCGDGRRREVVRGEIRELAPSGARHGQIAIKAGWLLKSFVDERNLGEVFAAETGFVLGEDPATVRAADAAFVRKERLPDPIPEGFFPGPPDLAVEVISPGDLAQEVERKVEDYLQAGTRLVWVVYPTTQTVTVYRTPKEVRVHTREDELSGEDALPGFMCRVADLFA